MAISLLCLVHCIGLPVLFALLPWLAPALAHDESVHKIFAAFVLPIGLMALASGYRHHRQAWIFLVGVTGLIFVGSAAVAGEQMGESLEHALSIVGSIQLVISHFFNLRQHGKCCTHAH